MFDTIAADRLVVLNRPGSGYSQKYLDALHDVKEQGHGQGMDWLKQLVADTCSAGQIARKCALNDVYRDFLRRGR